MAGRPSAAARHRRRVKFGTRIRELRHNRQLSQEKLAELAGLDRSYMGGIERGDRNVAFDNICRVADALKVHPRELFPNDL
jgi:transcriptional regulator with XRE-family HTH domain